MSSVHHHISSFNAGEISPLMGARFGVEKVASGCRRLRNFIIHPHGPAFRRPGMEFMGMAANQGNASSLRSFQFSASTTFVLELSVAGLRVWKNGAQLSLLAPVSLPYALSELHEVQMCQINDVVYLTHRKHAPRKLVRYSDQDWRLENINWRWPALLDENPGSQALPDEYDLIERQWVFVHGLSGPEILTGYYSDPFYGSASNHKVTVDFMGTPPLGPKRLVIESMNYSSEWVVIYDNTWNSYFPASYPFDAGGDFLSPGRYQVTYIGDGWFDGSNLGSIRLRNAVLPIAGSNAKNLIVNPTPRPDNVILPMGGYKICVSLSGSLGNSWLKLEFRDTIGTGDWSEFRHFDLSQPSSYYEIVGITISAREWRWFSNAYASAGGYIDFYTISKKAPYQTSIRITNSNIGSGRGLLANRPLFRDEHVGAFWQITHRRDDAFVELISTSLAVAATGILTLTGIPAVNQTVTIGGRVYTWKSSFTPSPVTANEVAIGANATVACTNLAAAINAGVGAGTSYSAITSAHVDVTAVAVGSTVVVTARRSGAGANAVPLNEGMTNGSWNGVLLQGGVDANITINAAHTEGLRVNGKWNIYTYGSWESTLYLERQNAAGNWDFVRSWKANKDRNIAESGETRGDETLRLRIIAGTASESSNAAAPRFVLEASDARVDGLVRITSVDTPGAQEPSVSATCDVIVPCVSTNPTYVWTEGAWSNYRGYPSAVGLHENRLWFGGTNMDPMRLWATATGDIENFRRSSLDDGSLSFTPSAGELNPIQWMLSQGSDLIIGTRGDEWTLSGEGKPITPTNVMFKPQSRFGSSSVAALMASEVVVFVQRGGRKVRRIAQRSNNEPWATSDMTVLAEHVAQDGIIQMAYSSNPNAILWAVTKTGKLLGMTLEVEQNVFGWHVHETNGTVESVAVVYGTEADEVWLAVKRDASRFIERLDTRVFGRNFSEYQKMIFCDNSSRFQFSNDTSVVTNLGRFKGKPLVVLADGKVVNGLTVSDTSLTLPTPAKDVIVGLPYTSELQPSFLEMQTAKGSAQGMNWRVSRMGAFVHESRGGEVAEHPEGKFEKLSYPETGLFSGDVETVVESSTRKNVHAMIRTSEPLPLNIGSLTLKLDVYGD